MRMNFSYNITVLFFTSLLFATCKKEFPFNQKKVNEKLFSINVSNLDQLYAAVNDPANAGCRVVLASGTYILDASYPNEGRIELQENMTLQGQHGKPELVIIDQTVLPGSSFGVAPFRTGGIRMGRGDNTLEWLTVKGNANALSAIDTDLPSTETHIRIAHLIVSGSQIGIDIRNRLAEHAGRVIDAEIEHNTVCGNTAGFGSGIVVQNVNGATGGIIGARLKENYIHGNRVGLRVFNNAASSTVNNGRIVIEVKADRIEGNGLAMYLSGGICQVSTAVANNNFTGIEFHGSSITNNNPVPMPAELKPIEAGLPPGGMFVCGGISTSVAGDNKATDNRLEIIFNGTDISNNGTDVNAFGAWSRPPVLLPGTNNLAKISLQGLSKNAIVVATASVPFEPAGTNVVSIIR